MANAFQQEAVMMKVDNKAVPIESPNSMSSVERYHTPFKRAFAIIKAELPKLSDKEILQYSVKSLNDSVGPDGLVPTLLVYGALPRFGLLTDKPAHRTFERTIAARNASDPNCMHCVEHHGIGRPGIYL